MGERMRGLVTPQSRRDADTQSAALASQSPTPSTSASALSVTDHPQCAAWGASMSWGPAPGAPVLWGGAASSSLTHISAQQPLPSPAPLILLFF